MPDIFHRVGIKSSSPTAVYTAITTLTGLRGWWTINTEGSTELGGVIRFDFEAGGFDVRVEQLDVDKHLVWRVLDGPTEWIDTEIRWDLDQEGDHTIVRFEHTGWRAADDFMSHCSTKWAVFLLSLKSLVETGSGSPWPDDFKIDNTYR